MALADASAEPHRRRVLGIAWRVLLAATLATLAVLALFDVRAALAVIALVLLVLVVALTVLSRRDAQTVLTLLVVVLLLLPQDYVLVGPLKSVGNPAQLIGLIALALWCAGRLLGLIQAVAGHPVRWVLLLYAIATASAFAAAMNRTLTEAESTGATRALFPAIAALGVALLSVDGLKDRERVETVLQRLVWVAGAAAVVGIMEFAFPGFDYRGVMHLPGLTTTTELVDGTRSGFDRIHGAAAHPIEYAVTLAALAPIALHFALYGLTSRRRQLSALALLAILIVTPMTVARSGILTLAVGLAFYAVHLSSRAKLNVVVLGVIGLGAYRAAVPGLLGTLKSLILVGEADPSIAGRTEDYAKIPGLSAGYEVFGRGLGTFQPLSYFYLDNQYLGSLLEGGMVALLVLITVYVVGVGVARGIRHRSAEPSMRGMGQALGAAITGFAVAAGTFDELSFRQAAFTLFLLLGCSGALWSILRAEPKRRRSGEPKVLDEQRATAVG